MSTPARRHDTGEIRGRDGRLSLWITVPHAGHLQRVRVLLYIEIV